MSYSLKAKALIVLCLMLISGFAANTLVFHKNNILPTASGQSCGSLGIDGSGTKHGSSVTSIAISITTSCSNDIVIVYAIATSQAVALSVSGASLTWNLRDDVNWSGDQFVEYWAEASSALSSASITVSSSSSTTLVGAAFGISFVNFENPFDYNLLATTTGSSTTPSIDYTSSNANDIILGLVATTGAPSFTAGSGFTICCGTSFGPSIQIESKVVTSKQTNLAVGYTLSISKSWIMFADALVQDPPFGLDGSAASNNCSSCSSLSVSLTTNYQNDIVVVTSNVVNITGSGRFSYTTTTGQSIIPVFDYNEPTDGSYTCVTSDNACEATLGYFFVSTPSSVTVQISSFSTASAQGINLIAFAISGVSVSTPIDFEGNPSIRADCFDGQTNQLGITADAYLTSTEMFIATFNLGFKETFSAGSSDHLIASSFGASDMLDEYVSISAGHENTQWTGVFSPTPTSGQCYETMGVVIVGNAQTTPPSSWADLHGFVYTNQNVTSHGNTIDPQTDFRTMHNDGFNFARVVLDWENLTFDETKYGYNQGVADYQGNLTQIAYWANYYNISLIYTAMTRSSNNGAEEPGAFFPSSGWSCNGGSCGTGSTFYDNWWTTGSTTMTYTRPDGVKYTAWKAEVIDFWTVVLGAVDAFPSTLGYELANEPVLGGASVSNLQTFYSSVGQNLTTSGGYSLNSQKMIAFMGPNGGMDANNLGSSGSDVKAAPKGIPTTNGIVLDGHCYFASSTSECNPANGQNWGPGKAMADMSQSVSTISSQINSNTWGWIGEWAICNPAASQNCISTYDSNNSPYQINTAQAQRILSNDYVGNLTTYNFANTYNIWTEDSSGTSYTPNGAAFWYIQVLYGPNATLGTVGAPDILVGYLQRAESTL